MAQSDKPPEFTRKVIIGAVVVFASVAIAYLLVLLGSKQWIETVDGARWGKILGGPKDDVITSIVALPDGGFAVAGWTESKGAGNKDAWVVRLDGTGRVLWDKTYGGPEVDVAASIVALPGGGFAVAGWTDSKGAGKADVWVLRLDAMGNLLWDKTFGGSKADQAKSIVALADGGFAVAGWTRSKGAGERDAWVLRLDAKGDLLWDKTFGGSKADHIKSIVTLPYGGFAATGQTRSTEQAAHDPDCILCAWVLRLDSRGQVLWNKLLGGPHYNSTASIVALPDGDFAVAGGNGSGGVGSRGAWVMRLDGNGKLYWNKTYSGFLVKSADSIVALPDGGFAVAGDTLSVRLEGGLYAWVGRLDISGKLLWEKTFGGPFQQAARSIVALPDGGFAVAGWTISEGPGKSRNFDAWVVRLGPISAKQAAK